MRDWLRPDRARALLDLIEQCPTACRWREAASQDGEYLKLTAVHGSAASTVKDRWAPRASEYDLHSMLLAHLTNLVGTIAEGKRIENFDPIPGPRTAQDRMQAVQSFEAAQALISMLTPHALIDR